MTENLAHFDHDEPALVWYMPDGKGNQPSSGWLKLEGHACNGYRLDYLSGLVLPIPIPKATEKLLYELTDELFLSACEVTNMDYEINSQHRDAYTKWLNLHDLQEGQQTLFKQAVYPLAPTLSNLSALGVDSSLIPAGAQLLVLGWNCD